MSEWTMRCAALAAFLVLLIASSAFEMRSLRHEGTLRLQQDAQSLAKRTSLYLANAGWEMDAPAARSSIFAEMEDLRLAGMLVYDREGLLEGMRRDGQWEPVPWDELVPENSVEASAPLMIEDVPVGEVVIYLSRRTLEEELAAKARRELTRVAVLALIPCIAMAQLLWQRALSLAPGRSAAISSASAPLSEPLRAVGTQALVDKGHAAQGKERASPALHVPNPWDKEEQRKAYLDACRAFVRDHHGSAALLYQLVAREDWGELRATAKALHEAALALHAQPLAKAALSLQVAALANTSSAARHVETCIPLLAEVLRELKQLLCDNHGERL